MYSARMKEVRSFRIQKTDLRLLSIWSNALNKSNNIYCFLCAYLNISELPSNIDAMRMQEYNNSFIYLHVQKNSSGTIIAVFKLTRHFLTARFLVTLQLLFGVFGTPWAHISLFFNHAPFIPFRSVLMSVSWTILPLTVSVQGGHEFSAVQ